MPIDYYSLIQPFFFSPTCTSETGYHMYSYALDYYSSDPTGSSNMSKLSSIQLVVRASQAAIDASAGVGGPAQTGVSCPQKFEFVCMAVNWNILRIASGSLGFPIL